MNQYSTKIMSDYSRFRWVELQVAAICDARYVYCAEDVEEALKKLPPTLEATYSRIIERLGRSGSTTRVVMETILKLLICVEDSMSLKIIQEASSICQDNPIGQLRKLQIIRMSQSLIVFDEESDIFRFAHLSVREFLENDERFSADASHAIAAELCLRCLLYGNNYVDRDGIVTAVNKDNDASKKIFLPEFYKYALLYWPTHCAKAKQRRLSDRLQYLLYRFLGIYGEKSYYTHWIDELFRARRWDGWNCEKNDSYRSSPPHPIFFICTHGFPELLPQIERTYSNSLDMENHMGLTPIEVAAYYGHLTTVQVLIGLRSSFPNPITWIDSACQCAAAGSPNVEVIEYLMSQTSSAKIDDDLVCAAALNPHCSVRMLETVLAKAPQFVTTNNILRKVGRDCKKADSLQILLSRMQTHELDEETMVAACQNRYCSADILRLFLGHCDQFQLTEDFMVRATEEFGRYDEILDILCSNGRTYSVTSRLLKAAASSYDDYLMSVFLPRYESDEIGEDVFQATVGNVFCGLDVLKMLTDRFRLPTVTEQLLRMAVGNSELGTEILEVLLSFPNQIKRPEEAIYRAITRCPRVQPDQIAFIRRRFPTAEVTDSLIMTAVSNPNLNPSLLEAILSSPRAAVVNELMLERAAYLQHWKTMKILLQNAPDCSITEKVLLAAALNPFAGFEVLKMLIILPGVTQMGNDSILAILKNEDTDTRVVRLLFEKQNIIPVSAHLLAAAYGTGLETLTYLLERCNKDKASFFKSLLQPPNQARWSELAHSVAEVLVRYLNEEHVTQELWKEVAARESRVPMKELLSRIEPTNYQDLLDAAAGNNDHGYDLVKYLLSIGKVAVSKETFLAAARNWDSTYYRRWDSDARIFCFLLQHCQPSAWGQEIALVAATNRLRGRQIVELMMRNSIQVTVNQELVQASATNPKLLDYLLCHPQDGVIDTTETVKLAANGGSDGLEALQILKQSGWSVKITEEALKTICRIEYGFPSFWDDLVLPIPDRIKRLVEHPTAIITEEVIKESVKNEMCGVQIAQTLMNCSKNQVSMSQVILELSAQNEKCGYELIKYIFDDYASNVKVTKTLLALASKNIGCRQEILEFLLDRACIQGDMGLIEQNIAAIRDDPHGITKALFRAAYRGHTAAFKVLIKIGTDVTHQLGNLGNVLHVASFAGQLQIVKMLVPYASSLDVPGGQFRSPLLAALVQDRVDIATCLFDGGVSTETVDTMQRTILHRLIRSEKSHHITALLELGASTEARDLQGYTALHHAVLGSSISNTAALLKASAPNDVKDNFGWTPLHWAARKGDVKKAELLISAGASLHSSDSQGRTPLGVAVVFGQDKLQKTLWTEAGVETLDLQQGLYADGIKCDACELVSQLGRNKVL